MRRFKNCNICAINTYFNTVDGPYEERFTVEDWKKGLNSKRMHKDVHLCFMNNKGSAFYSI